MSAIRQDRPRSGSGSWFGRLAAVPAAVVVYMSVFFATWALPTAAWAVTPWPAVGAVLAAVGALLTCGWSVRAIRRFFGRLMPLHASGERLLVPAAGVLLLAVLAAVQLALAIGQRSMFVVAPAGTWLVALVLVAGDLLHGRPRDDAFVLYLRTFFAFSDRAVMAVLFKLLGGKRRIVALTPRRSNAASWDPVLIAFEGNPLFSVSAKIPLFMTANDDVWQSAVRGLMEGATHTIVDVSDLTVGVQAEIEMLCHGIDSDRIIWLCEASRREALEEVRRIAGARMMPPDRVVVYRHSYAAAAPRLALGFGLSVFFFFLLPMLRNLQTSGAPQFSNAGEAVGYAVGSGLLPLLFFVAVFLRTAVDSDSTNRLRTLLARVENQEGGRGTPVVTSS